MLDPGIRGSPSSPRAHSTLGTASQHPPSCTPQPCSPAQILIRIISDQSPVGSGKSNCGELIANGIAGTRGLRVALGARPWAGVWGGAVWGLRGLIRQGSTGSRGRILLLVRVLGRTHILPFPAGPMAGGRRPCSQLPFTGLPRGDCPHLGARLPWRWRSGHLQLNSGSCPQDVPCVGGKPGWLSGLSTCLWLRS